MSNEISTSEKDLHDCFRTGSLQCGHQTGLYGSASTCKNYLKAQSEGWDFYARVDFAAITYKVRNFSIFLGRNFSAFF